MQRLDNAIKFVTEHDYHELSLRNLAKDVGLTTGAFYKKFKSRDELFLEMTEEISNQIASELTKYHDDLLKIGEVILQKFVDQPHLMEFVFFNPEATKVISLSEQNIKEFPFLEMSKKLVNKIPVKDHHVLFIQLWSFIQGYGVLILKNVTKYDPKLLKNTFNKLIGENHE